MAIRAGIAMGSNLGNRLSNLRQARDKILRLMPSGTSYLQAPIYISEPVNCPPKSPDFFNTVVEIDYIGEPYELLSSLQQIETDLGRTPSDEVNAPRLIDLDILYFDDLVLEEEDLIIPHPRLTYRRFVLHPLADIRPHLILPGDVTTVGEHFRMLDSGEPDLSLLQTAW